MPILLPKHQVAHRDFLRDVRPASVRFKEYILRNDTAVFVSAGAIGLLTFGLDTFGSYFDVSAFFVYLYLRWNSKQPVVLSFKLPQYANCGDSHNPPPGKSGGGKAEGILYLGNNNDKDDDFYNSELWLTNNDARTHILYLGTTGSGKTEGLKAMVTNALAWGSGYAYTDGKADTDLWASLYSIARRFGRDDDVLILNYMTANSDDGALSNTMNPFSNGSSSYLANMVVSFMPDAGGDNAMWKERAVALMFALMPALTFKRDKQGLLLDVGIVRDYIEMQPIIRLSRDNSLPERILHGLQGYLRTLPGYVDAAFDDDGNEKPPSPDQPMYDLQVARQQHGYLSMQFTRALQSLADEYGYIFKAQLADIDILDLVLNRRILVVLIPALEKAGDEAANLGKIVAASFKGMMGATLGNTVEGSWETAIGSKQTRSASSFMTVFDEVGYYTAPGMAVMAAQARSLGFCLVFASQDLPSMERRVKQEAKSIVGNCNLKILGRIEDPTDTKDFVTKHGGTSFVMEAKGLTGKQNTFAGTFMNTPYYDDLGAGMTGRQRVDYDHLRGQREGEAHLIFGDWAVKASMFFVLPEKQKALRVHRFLPVPGTNPSVMARDKAMNEVLSRLQDPSWTAAKAQADSAVPAELAAIVAAVEAANKAAKDPMDIGPRVIVDIMKTPIAEKKETERRGPSAQAASSGGYRASESTAPIARATPSATASARTTPHTTPMVSGDEFAIDGLDSVPQEQSSAPVHSVQETKTTIRRQPTGDHGLTAGDVSVSVHPRGAVDDDGVPFDMDLPEALSRDVVVMAASINDAMKGKGT